MVGFVSICDCRISQPLKDHSPAQLLLTSPDPEGAPLPPVVSPGVGHPPELPLALLAPAKYPHRVLPHQVCPGVGVDARLVQEEVLAVLVVL